MEKNINVRWGWLKFMYIYTIVGAGGFGLAIIFIPDMLGTVFSSVGMPIPKQDPFFLGITGSVYTAFALLSILGLRSPLKFAPVLLLQICYKTVWLIAVILPVISSGRLPAYAALLVAIFITYMIGDLIAIPFSYVFARQSSGEMQIQ